MFYLFMRNPYVPVTLRLFSHAWKSPCPWNLAENFWLSFWPSVSNWKDCFLTHLRLAELVFLVDFAKVLSFVNFPSHATNGSLAILLLLVSILWRFVSLSGPKAVTAQWMLWFLQWCWQVFVTGGINIHIKETLNGHEPIKC